MPNKIFLDINVLLDIPDAERENHFYSKEIFELADNGLINAYCSILSFNIFYYIARKRLGAQLSKSYMLTFLEIIKVVPADVNTALQSIHEPISTDFEDNMQYYSANQIKGINFIVTNNVKDFKKSYIPVKTPLQFLKIHQSK